MGPGLDRGAGGDVKRLRIRWLLGVLAVAGLYLWLTRPLAAHWTSAIPSSSRNVERPSIRSMMPGDHLQLLYHFELARGMLSGRIPWFQNPYEFNFGDDASRFRPGSYFLPLSAVYALLAPWTGQAAAWNATGLLSVWLSAVFTWLWLGRFRTDLGSRFLGTLIACLLPFRWVSLLGGSPAGFALFWLPLLAWLTDRAVREGKAWTGFAIGGTLLFCGWSDLQVFFFASLAVPLLALLSVASAPGGWKALPSRRWARVVPGLLLLGLLIVVYHSWRHAYLTESLMGHGRSWNEVRLFSPTPRGLWLQTDFGQDAVVYLGWAITAALLGAFALETCVRVRRGESAGRYAVWLAIAAAAGLVVWLSLGGNSPDDGWLLRQVRRAFPFYKMIRQPAKIYALMVLLLPWLVATGWGDRARALPSRFRTGAIGLLTIALLVEMSFVIRATICRLDTEQPAYAAILRDADASGLKPPRALVLPLWPGDSADSSVYLHYAQRYGLRLVNGYSPAVSRRYIEGVFRFLESANQGGLTSSQIAALRERGIGYVLLHEDLFPEKVSPFPVSATIDRLMANPELEFLAQSGSVWAFRIVAVRAPSEPGPEPVRFPARRWEFEGGTVRVGDPLCSGGAHAAWTTPGPAWASRLWRVAPGSGLRWLVRVRGEGRIRWSTVTPDGILGSEEREIRSSGWEWQSLLLPELPGFGQVGLTAELISGRADADCGRLIRGEWLSREMSPGAVVQIPARDFFHAGHGTPGEDAVAFRPDRDPAGAVLYGPKLPLAPGRYALEWEIASPAPAGTELGWFNVRFREDDESGRVPLRAGTPARVEWEQADSLPVNWVLVYNRSAPLTVRRAVLTRLR
jgi:hypothetical protein